MHLAPEHARILASVLERAEAEAARAEMIATGRLPDHPKLGHAGTHRPKLALSDYLEAEAAPPASVHRGLFKGYTDVLANDTLGDCGEAMTLHGIEGMHHAAGTPVPAFVAQDAINLYEPVGGYVPGDSSTDNGTDNNVLVKYWQDTGVKCAADGSVHKIAGSLFVDPTDETQVRVAVYEFAAFFLAVNLPITAQGQTTWTVVGDGKTGNSAPGSWGGHDIPVMAYDSGSVDVDTWGVWTPASNAFLKAYAIQGFVVITPEMLGRTGVSPSGVNYTRLMADFKSL